METGGPALLTPEATAGMAHAACLPLHAIPSAALRLRAGLQESAAFANFCNNVRVRPRQLWPTAAARPHALHACGSPQPWGGWTFC